jgi:chemotaxis family two-component system response regulator Rcp1
MDRLTVRLLIVEDNPPDLYLIRQAFRDHPSAIDWNLTTATDGEKALHLLFSEEESAAPLPDLILLDWNLPGLSGNEVLQRIKGHQRLRRIPVLVFSTSGADRDIHDAYDNYANGYIRKPWDLNLFVEVVEAIERFWIAVARLPKTDRGGLSRRQ